MSLPLGRRLQRVGEVAGLVAVDAAALACSLALGMALWRAIGPWLGFSAGLPQAMGMRLWWFPLVGVGCLAYEGLYASRLPFWREFERLVKSATLVFLITLALVFVGKMGGELSRGAVLTTWLGSLVVLPAARYAGKRLLASLGIWQRRVLVLGAGQTGRLVVEAVATDPFLGYRIVGVLDDDPAKQGITIYAGDRPVAAVIGTFADVEEVMENTGARNLILATPGMEARDMVRLAGSLQRRAENVLVIPDLFGLPLVGVEAEYFFSRQTLVLRVRNNLASPLNRAAKRALDIVLGILVLAVAAVPMLLVALAIKLDSPGPVFFVHQRLGQGGRVFGCWKFRTMVVNAEEVLREVLARDPALRQEWETTDKLSRDPRITRLGGFLRRWSVDELPQIFNVLRGEMSLVGPRPRPAYHAEKGWDEELFVRGLAVRPGITGLWQVSGRSEIDFQGRLALDAWYVSNWSVWLDIIIMLRTIRAVLRRTGAY